MSTGKGRRPLTYLCLPWGVCTAHHHVTHTVATNCPLSPPRGPRHAPQGIDWIAIQQRRVTPPFKPDISTGSEVK